MTRIAHYIVAGSILVGSTAALAHTTLRSSSPASGSVLSLSPPEVMLEFIEPASLTSLTLVNAQGERRLAFGPAGSAVKFRSTKPDLAPGRNELRWRALSRDGHVIEGSIIVVLRRPAR